MRRSREGKWRFRKSWLDRSVLLLLRIEAGGLLQHNLLDSLPAGPADCHGKSRHFETGAGRRQIAEPVKNKTADRVQAFCFQFEPEVLAQVVEARVSAHQEASIVERLDVETGVAERRGIADDFLGDVGQRDNALGAAKFIHHDGESLGMAEKTSEQVERFHRLGDVGRGTHKLGIMVAWVEKE